MSKNQLDSVKSSDLIKLIHNLCNYEHRILYYGPEKINDVVNVLNAIHLKNENLMPIPQKTFFELAAQNFDCKVDEIAMVGDDLINDIQGAQNMGYTSFLVKTGKFRSSIYETSSISPDHLINSIAELPNYISSKSLF